MRLTRWAGLAAWGIVAATSGACTGGDGGGGFCSDFEFAACGGDVVGVWSSDAICPAGSTVSVEYLSEAFPGCSSTNVRRETTTISGIELTLNADGTYTRVVTSSERLEMTIDRECGAIIATQFMPGASLEQLCEYAEAELREDSAGSCTIAADLCECAFSSSGTDNDSGSYYVDTTAQTLSLMWGSMPYCVEGNQLSLQWDDTLAGQDATYVILTK